jgi:DNA polymerase
VTAAREQYLAAMGIPVWVLRDGEPPLSSETTVAELDWPGLAERVRTCTNCELHGARIQTVFGVGSENADLLIIGEAPGAEEDRKGEPFVGRAGMLLDAMLGAIALSREDVYIANILKCRPPNNRDPQREESTACTPYLERQIQLLQPKVILALGRIAAQWLLQSDAPIGRLRGKKLGFGNPETPLVASYHPAYLLRSPAAKAKSWEDLRLIRKILRTTP